MDPEEIASAGTSRSTPDDLLLGRLALEGKHVTREQLSEALGEQERARAAGGDAPLGQFLLKKGWIGVEDLARLLKEQTRLEEGLPAIPRYEIRERIGQGATAIVYRAWDRQIGRAVALKLHRDIGGVGEQSRLRFRREAQAAGGLAHPNVITIHDAGEQDGRLYLVMELVEGKSLDQVVKETRDVREIVRLVEKAARGVAAAHAKGVIHRDLKPANILVAANGEPKVGDFGLAHLVDSTMELTRTGATLGTPLYMAPEQVQGRTKEIGPATDVYALGAILYESLAGRPPFPGDGLMEIYGRIICEEPVPPRRLNPDVPEALETCVLRALEKEPRRRYADAGEFADDLRRCLEGEAIRAKPPGTVHRAVKWVRRHKMASAVLGVLLASVVTIASILVAGATARAREVTRLLREADQARQAYGAAVRRGGKAAEIEPLHQKAVGSYRSVLHLDPGNLAARRALAETYFDAYTFAERASDRQGMEVNRELTLFFDDGRFATRLVKTGTISIESDPTGAEALLLRKEGETQNPLGACPVSSAPVPIGPYVLILRKAGFPESRREVRIEWSQLTTVAVSLHDVSDARMKQVYEEAKTPFKRGIVLPVPSGYESDVPCVFRHRGRWYMLYDYVSLEAGLHETMLAESENLLSWKPKGKVLPAGSGGWDDKVAIGTVSLQDPDWNGSYELRTHDGRYWLSYLGDAQKNRKGAGAVGLAWTREPARAEPWERLKENPILRPDEPATRPHETRTLVKSYVLFDERRTLGAPFVMIFEGEDKGGRGREIGLAVSSDMVRWERYGLGSIITHGGGISGRAQVVRMGDVWVMFYFGAFWKPKAFDTFACSYDLVHWTLWSGPHLVEPSEPFDHLYAHKPWLVKHDGVVYHFYCAVGSSGRGVALATSKELPKK